MTDYRLLALVKGNVQGVGYRYHVMQHASRLSIYGYAQNLANGDVEVLAEGRQADLTDLAEFLYHASPLGQVSEVTIVEFIPIAEKTKTHFSCY